MSDGELRQRYLMLLEFEELFDKFLDETDPEKQAELVHELRDRIGYFKTTLEVRIEHELVEGGNEPKVESDNTF